MIDINQYAARDMWNALPAAERTKILEALKADVVAFLNHDYAGLPPEIHAGIVKGMPVEPPGAKPPGGPPTEDEEDTGKKKRGH